MSIYRLMAPVLFLSVLAYLGTSFLMISLQHRGNYMFKEAMFKILKSKTDINLKERIFNTFTEGMMMYVENKDVDSPLLRGVFISRQGEEGEPPRTINAAEGAFIDSQDSMSIILHLKDGTIHQPGAARAEYRLLKFDEYDLQLDFDKDKSDKTGANKGRREMSLAELKERVKSIRAENGDANSLEVEIQTKYALPFACIIFALIGAPLGIRVRRSGKGGSFGMGVIVLLVNYLFLIGGQTMGEKGVLSPVVAMWLPNIIMLLAGCLILRKTANGEGGT